MEPIIFDPSVTANTFKFSGLVLVLSMLYGIKEAVVWGWKKCRR